MDVREPDEVALGSIPSAVSLPLSQLRDALDKNFGPGEFQKVSSETRVVILFGTWDVLAGQGTAAMASSY